jgi:hypothetical protein
MAANPLKQDTTPDSRLVSPDPIVKSGWIFKVSSYYDEGVLVFAVYELLGYTSVKYFSNPATSREWIDTLVAYTTKIFPYNSTIKLEDLK